MDVKAFESEKLFQDGLDMYRKQLFGEALKRWRAVCRIDSEYPNIKMYINVCERQELQSLTSLENAESLLPLAQNVEDIELVDSVTEARSEFFELFDAGEIQKAVYCLELLLKERPSDADAMVFLIQAFHKVKKYSRMKECAAKLVHLQPYLARSYYLSGLVAFQLHKFKKARDSFSRGLRLRPDNFMILYHLGMSYLALGDPLMAESYFTRADKVKPGDPKLQQAFRRIESQKQDLNNSMDEVSQLLETEDVYADQLLKSANIYVNCHRLEKAFECLEKAIMLNSEYKEALYLRGKLEMEIGQYDKAYDTLTKTLNLMESIPRGYKNVVQFKKSGYVEEAANELLKILKLEPDYGAIHVELGKNYANSGQYERALEELDKGLILSPHYPDGHYYRGLCLMKINDLNGAVDSFNIALELNPAYSQVSFTLAELFLSEKRNKEALKILNRCKSLLDTNHPDLTRCESLIKKVKSSMAT